MVIVNSQIRGVTSPVMPLSHQRSSHAMSICRAFVRHDYTERARACEDDDHLRGSIEMLSDVDASEQDDQNTETTMRTIRIMEHISLDGVISPFARGEDSDFAHGGWTAPYRTAGGAQAVAEAQGSSFDLLLGRRTYDLWAGYWPRITSGPFAKNLNAATKYVATHRPNSLTWGPVADLGSDIAETVRRLKANDGSDLLVWGSSTLTSMLLDRGLVDEVVLLVYPILLGRGTRFFSDSVDPRALALVNTKAMSSGMLIITYRYVGSMLGESADANAQVSGERHE
jgi:dihydrofolate reductase